MHPSRHDGAQLENLIDKRNTASDVWADTAYRSAKTRQTAACAAKSTAKSVRASRCRKPSPRPTARSRMSMLSSTRLRAGERAVGSRHPNHQHGPGQAENRARESHLQHEARRLADDATCDGLIRLRSRTALRKSRSLGAESSDKIPKSPASRRTVAPPRLAKTQYSQASRC
jgi:hypothetical protein